MRLGAHRPEVFRKRLEEQEPFLATEVLSPDSARALVHLGKARTQWTPTPSVRIRTNPVAFYPTTPQGRGGPDETPGTRTKPVVFYPTTPQGRGGPDETPVGTPCSTFQEARGDPVPHSREGHHRVTRPPSVSYLHRRLSCRYDFWGVGPEGPGDWDWTCSDPDVVGPSVPRGVQSRRLEPLLLWSAPDPPSRDWVCGPYQNRPRSGQIGVTVVVWA